MEDILLFIKFTQKEFAEKLLDGQIYFNIPSNYNEIENEEIGDKNEGAKWIDNSEIANIKCELDNNVIDFKPISNSNFKIIQYDYYYLSFSLFTIYRSMFENNNTFRIDSKMQNTTYDSAIVIENPVAFLNTIIEKLKAEKIEYELKSVAYKNLNTGIINLTPFDKKEEHSHQNEFRIIIRNLENSAKKIEIGSIKDYCKLVPAKMILEAEWTAKRKS